MNARAPLVRLAIVLLPAGIALAGCGTATTMRRTAGQVAAAQAAHEYPSPAPPRQSASDGSGSAIAAARAFAEAYINWNAETVSADLQRLAARSIGQARSAMELAAAQTAGDYELHRGGIANSGSVQAVAPLIGQPNRYAVVTREVTTATATTAYQGLQPAWHVTVATVARLSSGAWVVSGWQPEN